MSFDGKYQILQMSSTHFCACSCHFRDREIKKCYLQKLGQDHGMQFSQVHHSMANFKIYKCLPYTFALDLTVCEKLIFVTFDL